MGTKFLSIRRLILGFGMTSLFLFPLLSLIFAGKNPDNSTVLNRLGLLIELFAAAFTLYFGLASKTETLNKKINQFRQSIKTIAFFKSSYITDDYLRHSPLNTLYYLLALFNSYAWYSLGVIYIYLSPPTYPYSKDEILIFIFIFVQPITSIIFTLIALILRKFSDAKYYFLGIFLYPFVFSWFSAEFLIFLLSKLLSANSEEPIEFTTVINRFTLPTFFIGAFLQLISTYL